MSDDSEDLPLTFPDSDTEENCQDAQDIASDAEPVTRGKKKIDWAPECLELLQVNF